MPEEILASYAECCGWPCDLETGKFADMPERWYLVFIGRHGYILHTSDGYLCLSKPRLSVPGMEDYTVVGISPHTLHEYKYEFIAKAGITPKNPISRQIRDYASLVRNRVYGPPPLAKSISPIDTTPPVTGLQMMVYAPIVCPGCMRQIQIPADGICPLCGTVVWRFQATGADDVR